VLAANASTRARNDCHLAVEKTHRLISFALE
jgi:hypothetical protein